MHLSLDDACFLKLIPLLNFAIMRLHNFTTSSYFSSTKFEFFITSLPFNITKLDNHKM